MDTFIVVLDHGGGQAGDRVKARLRDAFKNFYEVSPSAFLVAADALTEDVAQAAGLKGGDRVGEATGAVFRIAGYAGYTGRSLWEWLAKVES